MHVEATKRLVREMCDPQTERGAYISLKDSLDNMFEIVFCKPREVQIALSNARFFALCLQEVLQCTLRTPEYEKLREQALRMRNKTFWARKYALQTSCFFY